MPGITLQMTGEEVGPIDIERFRMAQSMMVHGDHYTPTVQLAENGILLGHVAFSEYPIAFYRREGVLIALEGRIYNQSKPVLEEQLCELAVRICREPARASDWVREWILGHDGEYVCVIVAPDKLRVWAFCDPLGRLPLYYHSSENGLWLARECKFILRCREDNRLDLVALAQSLWMGYPLGRRSLFADVQCTPPAMLISVERVVGGELRTRVDQLFEFNFDEKDGSRRSAMQSGQDLADMFLEAARVRGSRYADECDFPKWWSRFRLVAVAMTRAGVTCVAATFLTSDGHGKVDAPVAEQIARELKIPWELIHIPAQTNRDEDRLVFMKDGLN